MCLKNNNFKTNYFVFVFLTIKLYIYVKFARFFSYLCKKETTWIKKQL